MDEMLIQVKYKSICTCIQSLIYIIHEFIGGKNEYIDK